MKNRIKIVTVCFTFVVGILLTGCGSKLAVNLNDYASVEFEGVNGKGTAHAYIALGKLEEACTEEMDVDSDKAIETFANFVNFEESIEISCDKEENLSNGDVVNIKISCDTEAAKNAGIKATYLDFSVEVEGLAELQPYDPFESLSVTYEGISPWCKAVVEKDSNDEISSRFVSYEFSNDSIRLGSGKLGESFTLTAELPEYLQDEAGVYLSETEKTYTIEGVASYITSMDILTEAHREEIFSDVKESFQVYAEEDLQERYDWSEPELVGMASVDGNGFHVSRQVQTIVAISSTLTDKTGELEPTKYYFLFTIADLHVDTDGKLITDYPERKIIKTYGSVPMFNYHTEAGIPTVEEMQEKVFDDLGEFWDGDGCFAE